MIACRKDRQTLLSKDLLTNLREYYKKHKPKIYLFEGATGGKYSGESVGTIVRRYSTRAGIKKGLPPICFGIVLQPTSWKTEWT